MYLARCVPKLLNKYFGSLNYGPPCIVDLRRIIPEIGQTATSPRIVQYKYDWQLSSAVCMMQHMDKDELELRRGYSSKTPIHGSVLCGSIPLKFSAPASIQGLF